MEPIRVFDARICFGQKYLGKPLTQTPADAMRSAQAQQAVMDCEEFAYFTPQQTIPLVNRRCKETPGLYGLYQLFPAITGDMPPVETLCRTFRENHIAGFRICSVPHRIPLDPIMLRDELAACEARKIPVFFHKDTAHTFEYLSAIMREFPQLQVVLSAAEEWPNARRVYPLLKAYSGIHLCLSEHVWMEGVRDLAERFGAHRLLYSSSFPNRYPGGTVMMVCSAGLSQTEQDRIFHGNLTALIGGMICD